MTPELFENRVRTDIATRQVLAGVGQSARFAPPPPGGVAVNSLLRAPRGAGRALQRRRLQVQGDADRRRTCRPSTRTTRRCSRRPSRPASSTWCWTWRRCRRASPSTRRTSRPTTSRTPRASAARKSAAPATSCWRCPRAPRKRTRPRRRPRPRNCWRRRRRIRQLRRPGEEELAGRGLGRARRRPGLLHPRRHGQALRGRGVRDEGKGRDRRPGGIRIRLPHHPADRHQGAQAAQLRGNEAELEAELRKQQAQKKYAESAEAFSNTVYEQSESLKPAADKLKLQIRTAQAVQRTPEPAPPGRWPTPSSWTRCSRPDAVERKRNTEAIEIGPSQMASGRIAQHSPARTRPFEEVKDQVRERVMAAPRPRTSRARKARRSWRPGKPTRPAPNCRPRCRCRARTRPSSRGG